MSSIHGRQAENGFIMRHTSLINEIYSARDSIDLSVVANLVDSQ